MEKTNKKPLEQRLKEASPNKPDFLDIFEVYAEDYFDALARLDGTPHFREAYQECIISHEGDSPKRLAELVHSAGSLPPEEGARLLDDLLVEPFARLEQREKEQKLKKERGF